MFDLVGKNLARRKVRSLLCLAAVMVSVYLNGSTLTMNSWMYRTMTAELAKYMGKIYIQQGGSGYPPFDSTVAQTTASQILSRADRGFDPAMSTPLVFVRTEPGMMPFMAAQSLVIGVPPGKEQVLLGDLEAAEGTSRFSGRDTAGVAILGHSAAARFGAAVGCSIVVNRRRLRVIGILRRSAMESVNISAVVPLAEAQAIFGKEGVVSAVLLTAADVSKTAAIAASFERDYPGLAVVTQAEMLSQAEKVLRMPLLYMSMMNVTAFVVAVCVIAGTMFMTVAERTKEIGILRALGSSRRQILATILLEAIALSLIGGIPGVLLALPMAAVMETELPGPGQMAGIIGFALAAALLGGFYPAWRAARVEPLEALRYE